MARLCPGLSAIGILLASSAGAAVWDGSSSGFWSNPNNWQGGTLPTAGSSVRFPTGVTRRVTTNDISGLHLSNITFEDSDYVVRGQAISLQNPGTPGGPVITASQATGPATLACPLGFDAFLPEATLFVFNSGGSTAGTLNIQGAITLNGNLLRVRDLGAGITISGAIGGTGDLFFVEGLFNISGPGSNTYDGVATIQGGTLRLNKGGNAIPPGGLHAQAGGGFVLIETLSDEQIDDGAPIDLLRNESITGLCRLDIHNHTETINSIAFAGGDLVGTNGNLIVAGPEVRALASTLPVHITPTTLTLGAGDHTFSVSNGAAGLIISSIITGSGNLIKAGPGSLTFAGSSANTYTGNTTVSGGVLLLSKTNTIAIPAGQLIIGSTADASTTTDVVRYADDNQIATAVDIAINHTGILDLNGFFDVVGDVNMNGGTIQTGTGTLQMAGGITATATLIGINNNDPSRITGNLALGTTAKTFTVNDNPFATDLIVDAVISGTVNWIKAGGGEMQLNAANLFTGSVTVNGGELIVADDLALGTSAGGVIVNNSATLTLFNALVVNELLTLNSSATEPGAIFASGTTNLWTGNITLSQTARIGVNSTSSLNLRCAISGNGDLEKEDTGFLQMQGSTANTYNGVTFVKAGTLQCDKSGTDTAIPGDIIIGDGVGGADADFVFFSFTQIGNLAHVTIGDSGHLAVGGETVGSIEGSGHLEIFNTGQLIVGGNNASTTFSGPITGGGSLVKRGTGTLTLEANNTYTGATIVEAGSLIVNGSQNASDVTLRAGTTLGGKGFVGDLSVATAANVAPGLSPGILRARNTVLSNDSVLHIELNGPSAGTGYDQLSISGSNTITGSKLDATLNFAPLDGQVFTIIANNGTDPVIGTFDGLANNAILTLNHIPLRINYNGNGGNDVTLTVTNLPLASGTNIITTGNGDRRIDPNECDLLFLPIRNTTAATLAGIDATLTTTTPGVIITEPFSSYPNIGPGLTRSNLSAFQLSTTSNFLCGVDVTLTLNITTATNGSFAFKYVLPSGVRGIARSFTNNNAIAIPDGGINASPIIVSNITGNIAEVSVSLFLTHQDLANIQVQLQSPDGLIIPIVAGAVGGSLGTNCGVGRMILDDDATQTIAGGPAPYVGTFKPVVPFSVFDGKTGSQVNGAWLLRVQDFAPNSLFGVLNCWSITITPATCADGGGECSICNGPFISAISTNDLRMKRTFVPNSSPSTCNVPVLCAITSGPLVNYDRYTFTNGGPATCVKLTIETACSNLIYSAAYAGAFNTNNQCANLLGDSGVITESPLSYSVAVASNGVFTVIVAGLTTNGCSLYTLRADGFDCPAALGSRRTANGVVVTWPTYSSGFLLECTTNLPAINWTVVTNEPKADGGSFIVTNSIARPHQFYRLRKP
jgi:autotransporter-associated beta strand protein